MGKAHILESETCSIGQKHLLEHLWVLLDNLKKLLDLTVPQFLHYLE